jgi:hypothetical protein
LSGRISMPATITVKYLGDEAIEKQIRERLEQELRVYDASWRVTVLGSEGNDRWEIKVYGDDGLVHGVRRLEADQTVDKIAAEAAHMVKIASQQKLAS